MRARNPNLERELAAVGYLHYGFRRSTACTFAFDRFHNVLSFGNPAKHDVPAVEPTSRDGRDKELRSIGVWTCVGLNNIIYTQN